MSRTATRLAVGFSVVALGALIVGAVLLGQAQHRQREDQRERFASRVAVAASLVESLFGVAGVGQARTAADVYGGRVTTAQLDRDVVEANAVFYAVLRGDGALLAGSTGTPVDLEDRMRRADSLARGAVARRVTYALSDVLFEGGRSVVETATPFVARDGSQRVLLSAAPSKVYRDFLDGTLAPLPSIEGSRAFVVDGSGVVIGSAKPEGSTGPPSPALIRGALDDPQGELTAGGEQVVYAAVPLDNTEWRIAVATPEDQLYDPVSGPTRWLPWIMLAVGALALAAIALLLVRLARNSARLDETNAELARSNHDLEQFASAASHDLQAPLRTVSGFAQLLEHRYGEQLDDEALAYLEHMRLGVDRMQQLIDDLLLYSRAGRAPIGQGRVDLEQVLEDVVASLGSAIDERDAIVTNDRLPAVRGERGQLLQVLQNLVGNALKFTEPHVRPRVHVAATRLPGEGMWRISVSDNGIGIDADTDVIFKMFGRLHPEEAYPGTGIGLALVKRIVERHGGRIWVEPAEGGGSVFSFTLPDRAPLPAAAENEPVAV